jgi:NADPH-dependent curcumin reductase CurA
MHYREQLVDGLDHAPQALNDLLDGKTFGKVVIRLGNDES